LSASAYLLLAVGLAALFLAIASISLWKHKKSGMGSVQVLGARAYAQTDLDPEGSVLVAGELWRARSFDGTTIAADQHVKVVQIQGHLLLVKR
jgi:membrane-bound serine protease (ClpP class)